MIMIQTPDSDPRVQRQQQKSLNLLHRLAEAEASHRALLEEHATISRTRHEAAVSNLLGDGPAPQAADARLAELKLEIATAEANLSAVRDAAAQQQVIERGIRKQVMAEIRSQLRADVRVVIRRQAALLAELEALQRDVHRVAGSGLIEMDSSFAQLLSLLPVWRRSAERLCGPIEPAAAEPIQEEALCEVQ